MYVQFALPEGIELKNSVRIKVILESKNDENPDDVGKSTPVVDITEPPVQTDATDEE